MGSSSSKKLEPSRLLQCAIDGDIGEVQYIVDEFVSDAQRRGGSNGKTMDEHETKAQLKAFVGQSDGQGNAALHGAVFAGHLHVVKYLVEECGSCVDAKNGLGCSPLWLAAGYDRCEVLEYILRVHTDPKMALLDTNEAGDSSLLAASSRGNLDACKLIETKAKELGIWEQLVAQRNKSGDYPLIVAISSQPELVELLLLATPPNDLNEPNEKGMTPFLIACERDDAKLGQKLLDHGAKWDGVDANGSSALCVAAFCGSREVLSSLLLNKSHLLNMQNNAGCTALWLAARTGRPEIVEMLLTAGCDADIANNDGLRPLDVAKKYDRAEAILLLEKAAESQ